MSRALLGFKEDPSDHRAPALTSGRPYHAARAHSVAIGILEVERGIKHDPAILDLFVRHDAEIRSAVFRPGMHLIMDQFAKRTSCRLIQSGRMQANGRGKAAPPFVCRDQHLRARRGGHVPERFCEPLTHTWSPTPSPRRMRSTAQRIRMQDAPHAAMRA
jgi:hypothetical protein